MSYQRKVDPSSLLLSGISNSNETNGEGDDEKEEEVVHQVRETRLDHYKLRARIDVNKDDVQKVVPIAKVFD